MTTKRTIILFPIAFLLMVTALLVAANWPISSKEGDVIKCMLRKGDFYYIDNTLIVLNGENAPYIAYTKGVWPAKYRVESIGFVYAWTETASVIDSIMQLSPIKEKNYERPPAKLPDCK